MHLIEVEQLGAEINGAAVLKDINFISEEKKKLGICGETGSGKSSLLKIIAGLLQASAGKVKIAGEPVIGPKDQLMPGHPGVVYMSQHFELPGHYTVSNILEYENRLEETDKQQLYEVCRITHLLTRKTSELSGGERQRISLARAIITKPRLLLLDEPFSNLDFPNRQAMQRMLDDLISIFSITIILVSHDSYDLLPWADRILVMKNGEALQIASPEDIYFRPANEYTAALFGNFTLVPAHLLKDNVIDRSKRLLVRPGEWVISAAGEITATIRKTYFFGDYMAYDADTEFGPVHFKSDRRHLVPGVSVQLQPAVGQTWYL